jgi:hypothetical protein
MSNYCCVLGKLQVGTSPVWGRNKLKRPQLFILLNLKNSGDIIGWDDPKLKTLQAITAQRGDVIGQNDPRPSKHHISKLNII